MSRKVILMILDGWWIAEEGQEHKSAIHLAKTTNFDKYWKIYPHSTLKTFGEHVGLPDGQMWNSEVGHMSIWSGRIIYQDLVKIGKMMHEWSFENIPTMQEIIAQAKAENKPVHIVWLLSDGWVHSHIDHIKWMIDILDRNNIKSLVHAITDGRDVDPKSGIKYISDLLDFMKGKNAQLVDVIGRYYAMDRDNRRERVKLATDLYTRWVGKCTNDILAEMQKNYDAWITDEFIKPIIYTPNFVQKDLDILKHITFNDEDNILTIKFDNFFEVDECIWLKLWIYTINDNDKKWEIHINNIQSPNPVINKKILKSWNKETKTDPLQNKFWYDNSSENIKKLHKLLKKVYNYLFSYTNIHTLRLEDYDRDLFSEWNYKGSIIKNEFPGQKWFYYIYNPNQSDNTDNIHKSSEIFSNNLLKSNSIVIMTNFRTDRGRELVDALCQHDHIDNDIYKLNSLTMVTMTNYDDKFTNIKVLLPRDNITETLGELISKANKKQIRIAETEKYPHVTFFFSWGQEAEFIGEKRILVNSPKVATYDMQPEMSAPEITAKILPELEANWPDFVVLNFANTDMVGHTGNMSAAIKASETVDNCLWEIVNTALANDYDIIVIADHGNADIMTNDNQSPNTAHTVNLVPCIYISKDLSTAPFGTLKNGKLADIAPTILQLMEIEKPASMDGVSLL